MYVDGGFGVSLALDTLVRNCKIFCFGTFTEFDLMS